MVESVKRVNVTLPLEEYEWVHNLAADGRYPSVSACVTDAIRERLAEADASGFVLDTGALIALEKPARAKTLALLFERIGPGGRLVLSAGSVAEARRASPRQTPLVFLLRRQDLLVEEITVPVAKSIGSFLAHVKIGDDIVDAHVVMLARHFRLPVITTDPGDLRALDPRVPLIEL